MFLGGAENLPRLLERLPGVRAALPSRHAGLSLAHPLGYRLVAVLRGGSHGRSLPLRALLHDARRHGIGALLEADVRGRLLRPAALEAEDLGGAAGTLGVLAADALAGLVVGALTAVGGAAGLGLAPRGRPSCWRRPWRSWGLASSRQPSCAPAWRAAASQPSSALACTSSQSAQ